MPTYEYACRSCGSHLEVVQAFTDDALSECPGCSGPLRKVFGSIGITFKGSGFYKTDSRSSSTAKKGSDASSDECSSSSKEAKKEPAAASGDSSSPSSDAPTKKKTKEPAATGSGSASTAKSA